MKRWAVVLIVAVFCAVWVSAEKYDAYVFDEPVRLGEITAETVADLVNTGLRAEEIVHTVGDREVTEIIVSGNPPWISPLYTVLTQDGARGFEVNKIPGELISGNTASGLTDSYRIDCEMNVSLHFLFYKDRHVYTTNSAAVTEEHRKYKVISVGKGKLDRDTSEENYETMLYADGFDGRIETAADIGYNYKSHESSYVTEYTVKDDSGNEVCTMPVPHPEKNLHVLPIIAGVTGTLGLGLMGLAYIRRRRKA